MFFKALLLTFALEVGWLSGDMYNYTQWTENQVGALYTTLEANVSYKALYVSGLMASYFGARDITHYSPFQTTFVFGAGLQFDTIKVGYEHSCFHPMQPYATIVGYEVKPKYEGGYDKFFVRFELVR